MSVRRDNRYLFRAEIEIVVIVIGGRGCQEIGSFVHDQVADRDSPANGVVIGHVEPLDVAIDVLIIVPTNSEMSVVWVIVHALERVRVACNIALLIRVVDEAPSVIIRLRVFTKADDGCHFGPKSLRKRILGSTVLLRGVVESLII